MDLICKDRMIKGGLFNLQSVTNKTILICELIDEHCLDFLILTETWLSGTLSDKSKIKELTPPSYKFVHNPRLSRGGGVGMILKKSFKNITINKHSQKYLTFEYLDISCNVLNRKLRILSIYRPPHTNINDFLTEFENVIEYIGNDILWTIILGDFNIWLDDVNEPKTKKFLDLTNSINLINKVHQPTARSGHTLDLVITNDITDLVSEIEGFQINTYFHFMVTFHVNIIRTLTKNNMITYRSKKDFVFTEFIDSSYQELMLASEELCTCPPHQALKKRECVNCLCKLYNEIFNNQYDMLCPLKSKSVNIGKDAPWFNSEIR